MILVLVEHYLTEEAQYFFPEWISQVREALRDFEGFIALDQIKDLQDDSRSLLLLKFESIELLRVWSSSEIHDQMLEKLKPVMLKKQYSQIFKL